MSNALRKSFASLALLLGLTAVAAIGIKHSENPIEYTPEASSYPVLVGSFNSWNSTNMDYPLELESGTIYSWTGILAIDAQFKINIDGNSSNYKGFTYLENTGCRTDSVLVVATTDDNIKVATSYKFVIKYDTSNTTISSTIYHTSASNEGVTGNTMRIWLDRGAYETEGNGVLVSIQYGSTIADTSDIITPSGWVERSGGYFFAYFDIPIQNAGTLFRAVRLSEKRGTIWNKSASLTWSVGDNSKVLYVGGSVPADNATLTTGIIDDSISVKSSFAAIVLEGYLSCSDSVVNGAGAFEQMNSTFFMKADGLTWKLDSYLDTQDVTDYAWYSNYTAARGDGIQVDAYEKYVALQTRYIAVPEATIINPQVTLNGLTLESVIMFIAFSILMIGGYFFVRRLKLR